MLSTSEKIVAEIENKQLKPRPRWQFIVKKYSILSFTLASLILGSLAFSLVLHLMNSEDWGIQSISRGRFLYLMFISLPFAWLIFLVLFIVSVFYNFRQLRNGYKYPCRTIVLSALITIVFFGSLAALFGLNKTIHTALSKQSPFYREAFDPRSQAWNRPQVGFLAGQIIKLNDDGLMIRDPRANDWQIEIDTNTIIAPEVKLELNEQIKVIGAIDHDFDFDAQEIVPWERPALKNHQAPPPNLRRPVPIRGPINPPMIPPKL